MRLRIGALAGVLCGLSSRSAEAIIRPFAGDWDGNGAADVALWNDTLRRALFDAIGDGIIDGVSPPRGAVGDIPFFGDWDGDGVPTLGLYRPSTGRIYIYAHNHASVPATVSAAFGAYSDIIPIAGDWDGIGGDGFALYRTSTRQLRLFQTPSATTPFATCYPGNSGDIPLAGDWDGDGSDGFALYRPAVGAPDDRTFWFWEHACGTLTSSLPGIGNPGDVPVVGRWGGQSASSVALWRPSSNQFWYFRPEGTVPFASSAWTDTQAGYDETSGRQVFYTAGVPHTDTQGAPRSTFSTSASFFPRGIYGVSSNVFGTLADAGFNVAHVWSSAYDFATALQDAAAASQPGEPFKLIFSTFGTPGRPMPSMIEHQPGGQQSVSDGLPLIGRFSSKPGVQFGVTEHNRSWLDLDGTDDAETSIVFGDPTDRHVVGDWDGDGVDTLALFRRNTGDLIFANANPPTSYAYGGAQPHVVYGYVEFTASETNTARMLGLSNGDSSQSYGDIDFAIDLTAEHTVTVYEQGIYRGTFGTYATGDRLRVSAEYGVVRYLKNGSVFYTSAVAPTYPLLVDTALYTSGATLKDVMIGDRYGAPPRPVWWSGVDPGVEGITLNGLAGNTLTKIAVSGWGNAGTTSSETLLSSDIVLAGDWDGLGGEGYLLYRLYTRELRFFQNMGDTVPNAACSTGNYGDLPVVGDWNGDGRDDFALYRPAKGAPDDRTFWFWVSPAPPDAVNPCGVLTFSLPSLGNPGDLPIAGDWNGDQHDTIGLFRQTQHGDSQRFWLHDGSAFTASVELGNPLLLRYDDDPGLLAWYVYDEPTTCPYPSPAWESWLDAASALFTTYMPISTKPHFNTLTYKAACNGSVWDSFANLGDVASADDYPFREGTTVTSLEAMSDTVTSLRGASAGMKPVWFVPQAFAQSVGSPPWLWEFPSPQEYRAMLFAALVHGATGFFVFSWDGWVSREANVVGIHPDPESNNTPGGGGYDADWLQILQSQTLWNAVAANDGVDGNFGVGDGLNENLDDLTPALLSPTSTAPYLVTTLQTTAGASPIRALLKDEATEKVLLVVNLWSSPLDVVIQLEGAVTRASVAFENRTIATPLGAIHDHFDGFGVHVYRFHMDDG